MARLKPPCVVMVSYVLPAIRAQVARELVEGYGLSRSEAADKMGVKPAAVTQYLGGDRGTEAKDLVEGSEEVSGAISQIAEGLARDELSVYDVLEKICTVCRVVRSGGLICEKHKDALKGLKGREECERPPRLCPMLGRNPEGARG